MLLLYFSFVFLQPGAYAPGSFFAYSPQGHWHVVRLFPLCMSPRNVKLRDRDF
jgi:hypothetical protein